MSQKDPLRILEAAYTFDVDDATWMERVVGATEPYGLGHGIFGYIAELTGAPGFRCMTGDLGVLERRDPADLMRQVSPAVWRELHTPSPLTYNIDALLAAYARANEPPSPVEGLRLPPMYGMLGGDARETTVLCFPCRQREDFARADKRVLDAVAAHLGATLRLRSLLRRAPSADDATTEAVLTADGQVLDARTSAAQHGRTKLADAARRVDRARTRKASPEERVALWTALVEGRWSIVESAESDGKRMLLACRNEPRTAPMGRLSSRQRSVVSYAVLGHSYKYIGYELGVSIATVAADLREAMRKLGMKSRVELIRTFGPAA
jgi:DNA-binding CsgD family transcriptional regulator